MDQLYSDLQSELTTELDIQESKRKKYAFLLEPVKVSKSIAKLLHLPSQSRIPRIDLLQQLYIYIVDHKLLDSDSFFTLNDPLKSVMKKNQVSRNDHIKFLGTDSYYSNDSNRLHICDLFFYF